MLFKATKLTEVVPLLLCMSFVFNLCYVPGANSFYLFLEYVLLNTRSALKTDDQQTNRLKGSTIKNGQRSFLDDNAT